MKHLAGHAADGIGQVDDVTDPHGLDPSLEQLPDQDRLTHGHFPGAVCEVAEFVYEVPEVYEDAVTPYDPWCTAENERLRAGCTAQLLPRTSASGCHGVVEHATHARRGCEIAIASPGTRAHARGPVPARRRAPVRNPTHLDHSSPPAAGVGLPNDARSFLSWS